MHFRHLIYLISLLALAACQVIPEDDRLIPVDGPSPQSSALIVEFTGFRCVNCPNAAERAHELLSQYPDHLVVVELHPATNTFCQTAVPAYDFTCPVADSIYLSMGGTSTTAFPTGVVDLLPPFLNHTDWAARVFESICRAKPASLSMSLAGMGEDAPREGRVSYAVFAQSPDSSLTGSALDCSVMLWLVEDSIVAPQMMPDGSQNMEYVHNHVLRGSLLEPTWGTPCQPLVNQPDSSLTSVPFAVPDSLHGQPIRPEHCSVVGILIDRASHEVYDVRIQQLNY